jgi:glutaminase A-like protein
VSNLFGLPLQVPHSYAKSDWQIITVAWLSEYPIKQELIERVYAYASTTPSRVPFGDLYDTITGNQVAFHARPVQGGIFALLALPGSG